MTLLQVAEKSAQIQQEASTNMEGISHDLVQENNEKHPVVIGQYVLIPGSEKWDVTSENEKMTKS